MTFEQFQQESARLRDAMYRASTALNAIPGISSGPNGLTPDSVKASQEYRAARREFDCAFRALQSFNGRYLKAFKSELAQEQRARREAMALASQGARPIPA